MKRCSKCQQDKPTDEFRAQKRVCRGCRNAENREWYRQHVEQERAKRRVRSSLWRAEHPEKARDKARAWRCAQPERVREARQRWREAHPEQVREAKARSRAKHREEARERSRIWRSANPERRRELDRHGRHLRRQRLAGGGPTERISLAELAKRDGDRCGICGRKVARTDRSIDHLVPVSHEGWHLWVNVQLAHRRCNSRRGNRGPAQLRLLG